MKKDPGTLRFALLKHFSPLNCTFFHCSRKTGQCNCAGAVFFNEINHLEHILKQLPFQKRCKSKHLQQAVNVMHESPVTERADDGRQCAGTPRAAPLMQKASNALRRIEAWTGATAGIRE
ncbi:MAG: hypothetical protein JNK17_00150 [Hydrogenophaga sp.]|nr:hypothetical protein [Hydrogenophaga sp.]